MRPTLLAGAAGALLLSGCGGGSAGAPPPAVRLQVTSPTDQQTVRDATATVRGIVRPAGANVTVRGQRAQVSGQTFSAQVSLDAGVNVIDVLASDGSARPALTAVRVRRITTVAVPDVTGLSSDAARTRVQRAGLKADIQNADGFLGKLLGGNPTVCQTTPASGTEVDLASTIHILVSRSC